LRVAPTPALPRGTGGGSGGVPGEGVEGYRGREMGGFFLGARGWCCPRVESASRPAPRPWPGVPGEGVEAYRGREWRRTGGGKWKGSSPEQGDGVVRGWMARVGPTPALARCTGGGSGFSPGVAGEGVLLSGARGRSYSLPRYSGGGLGWGPGLTGGPYGAISNKCHQNAITAQG
jgi:hypothetical protein